MQFTSHEVTKRKGLCIGRYVTTPTTLLPQRGDLSRVHGTESEPLNRRSIKFFWPKEKYCCQAWKRREFSAATSCCPRSWCGLVGRSSSGRNAKVSALWSVRTWVRSAPGHTRASRFQIPFLEFAQEAASAKCKLLSKILWTYTAFVWLSCWDSLGD